ncbi:MAG: OmpA family protein [Treponema sp.]|nr:OmpA family protein [Treponema sp.]
MAVPSLVSAQSTAMEIETLLNTNAVTYGQASRFVLEAANIMAADNQTEAFNFVSRNGWLPDNVGVNDLARLDDICLLLMNSFEFNGGIMYSIFGNPHYAYRELTYMEVVQGRTSSSMRVSGERLLFYINRILARQDAQDLIDSRDPKTQEEVPPSRVEPNQITDRDPTTDPGSRVIDEPVTTVVPPSTGTGTGTDGTDTTDTGATGTDTTGTGTSTTSATGTTDTTGTGTGTTGTGTTGARSGELPGTFVSVWFSQDSAVLLQSERIKLQEYARILTANPNIRIQVIGHAARSGADAYLNTLSRRRAQAVADYLVSLGVSSNNITVTSHGASRPIANNNTNSGMMANRRVEIIILEN